MKVQIEDMATEGAEPKITEAQAEQALRQMFSDPDSNDVPVETEQPAAAVEQTATETDAETTTTDESADEAPAAEAASEATEATAESDDIASLKQRTQRLEKQVKDSEESYNKRLEAMRQRELQKDKILRERFLRKSAATDRALKILRQSRSTDGVPEADVDRVIAEIEQTMNPQSASYAPPEPLQWQPQPQASGSEDQLIVLNDFFNERNMTLDESEKFAQWIRSEAATKMPVAEQQVAQESLRGFLHLAHRRWDEAMKQAGEKKRSDTVEAVRSVQRIQRQAARAAESRPAAPTKTTAAKGALDTKKLSQDDVSELVRQSYEQYL